MTGSIGKFNKNLLSLISFNFMAVENNNEHVEAVAIDIDGTAEDTHEVVVDTHASTGDESIEASLGINTQLFVFQLISKGRKKMF